MKEKLIAEKILTPTGINKNAHRSLASTRKHLVPEILQTTYFLDASCSMKERLHCIKTDLKQRPGCAVCGGFVVFEPRACRYLLTCKSCERVHRSNIKLGACPAQQAIQASRLKFHDTDENGSTGYQRHAQKAKLTKMKNVLGIMDVADYEQFKTYRRQVYWHSKQWDLTILPNFQFRGRCGVPGAFQLDHRFSIAQGFKNKIHPSIIGHIANLTMRPWAENRVKGTSSDITLEDLLIRIQDHPVS